MGVKSLWSLLTPVGRPIMLETVEGKIMAIDSSIWLYQFQATMRDKEGRGLVNAHVLGFLRRISKLLFYGIKPVFVFDGGAPTLKRSTLNERKKKKSGAALSHAKLAEKLLAAQMRREALKHAPSSTKTPVKNKKNPPPIDLNDKTVYLEDIDGSMPKTPAPKKVVTPSSSASKQEPKFYDHDPYKLPEVDLEAAVAQATRSTIPDPRLATEDELRSFIEDMRPEDFDVTSPAFRELPTEVQYEIVGDLRLKSRQTSYARLQNMLKATRTPLDFSKQQINNLRQRNALTQQLLMTTDSIGSAHIAIPVRIASERNKEYVLVKNDDVGGGWILGIRNTSGTREKPIEIDQDPTKIVEDVDSDADMEEVEVPMLAPPDPDLREYQQTMALSAISRRSMKNQPFARNSINQQVNSQPLFVPDNDDNEDENFPTYDSSGEDEQLALGIQASLDQMKLPGRSSLTDEQSGSNMASSSRINIASSSRSPFVDDAAAFESTYRSFPAPTPIESALSIANASPLRGKSTTISTFGKASLLSAEPQTRQECSSDSEDDMEEIHPMQAQSLHNPVLLTSPPLPVVELPNDSEIEIVSDLVQTSHEVLSNDEDARVSSPQSPQTEKVTSKSAVTEGGENEIPPLNKPPVEFIDDDTPTFRPQLNTLLNEFHTTPPAPRSVEEALFTWSRSPSPFDTHKTELLRAPSPAGDWDPADEMDAHAEEGEFANFMAHVKGQDLDDVRREIDDEIRVLNHQRKAALRDSEDITQQMISQIMTLLRLFGIPYITAPMEAEAQCAELMSLSLVDGVITDDSDVFLFGAQRVFKNMFNQSKTVECFLLTDLSRELGLDRDSLVRLAYLLGSDYVEGLPGVGPVVAMELLKEFPGKHGLHKFREWWTKVQSGKDKDEDNQSKFRKQFKKKFKSLYIPSDWPNSAVRDAYYHPTVDSSDEPFKWGLPDLDGLRNFLHDELGWGTAKVDELLLPIIQKMNKRGQALAMNRQGNLNEFFDVAAGSGTYAPRKRQAYASKRLQQVVSDFRRRQKSGSSTPTPDSRSQSGSPSADEEVRPAKKRKTSTSSTSKRGKAKGRAESSLSRAKRGGKAKGSPIPRKKSKPKNKTDPSSNDEDDFSEAGTVDIEVPLSAELRPRPKPRPAYKRAEDADIGQAQPMD